MLKRNDSWNRHNYPVQSPQHSPVVQNGFFDEPEKPSAVQLPKSIRAVKDSEKYRPKGRTIVVCLDGTGDKFDNDNSNIVHLVSCLKKDDPTQTTYYQAGIGTYGEGGLSGGVSAALDMAVGSGLGLHVRDAYHFLMHTYKEGDKICIFGFSRGAYTARCVAGMIHKVGLLPPRNIQQIPFAYEFYKDDTPQGWEQSIAFKKTFCIDVNVYFLGVFDSVASVGFIPRQLPLSSTPWNKSRYFRHAMALDERRAKFKVARFVKKNWDEIRDPARSAYGTLIKQEELDALPPKAKASGVSLGNGTAILPNGSANGLVQKTAAGRRTSQQGSLAAGPTQVLDPISEEEYERRTGHQKPFDTDVAETWFLGCHADVGGGAVTNETRHKLSNIPLRWMIRQCFECNTGILFKTKMLAEYGLDVHTLWPQYQKPQVPKLGPSPSMLEQYHQGLPPIKRRSSKLVPIEEEGGNDPHHKSNKNGKYDEGFFHFHIEEAERAATETGEWIPEQVEDWFDAMQPYNDQLVVAKGWWILEFYPVEMKFQKSDSDDWETVVGMNRGRYRGVEDVEPRLHWTVKHRIENMGYKLNVRTGRNSFWKIVA